MHGAITMLIANGYSDSEIAADGYDPLDVKMVREAMQPAVPAPMPSIYEVTTTPAPCPHCHGKPVREETAPGEFRAAHCTKCGGVGTLLAVKLREEYLRGWNDAFAAVEESLTEFKRKLRL